MKTFDIVWSFDIEDTASTPIMDVHNLCVKTTPYGDFRVIEFTPETWEALSRNCQVMGRVRHREPYEPVKRKDLTDAFGVEHICFGEKDVMYVFGGRK